MIDKRMEMIKMMRLKGIVARRRTTAAERYIWVVVNIDSHIQMERSEEEAVFSDHSFHSSKVNQKDSLRDP